MPSLLACYTETRRDKSTNEMSMTALDSTLLVANKVQEEGFRLPF
jgi:hypothetical protein